MIPQDAGVIVMLSFLVVTLIHLVKALDTSLEADRPNEGATQLGAHS